MSLLVHAERWCEMVVRSGQAEDCRCGNAALTTCEACGTALCEAHENICPTCDRSFCSVCTHACQRPRGLQQAA